MADKLLACRLCLRERKLAKSHIIPEFLYKPVYDEKHRLLEFTTDPKIPNRRTRQKGIWEKLLCFECEQQLSVYEKYVSGKVFGRIKKGIVKSGITITISDICYQKFKLFQLSIIWRASIATCKDFSQVAMGSHEEIIRNMLLHEEAGEPWDYGCGVTAIVTETFQPRGKAKHITDLIASPERLSMFGHNVYRMIFGGYVWLFVVSSHARYFEYKKLFLTKQGVIVVPVVRFEDTEYFAKSAAALKSGGKLK